MTAGGAMGKGISGRAPDCGDLGGCFIVLRHVVLPFLCGPKWDG